MRINLLEEDKSLHVNWLEVAAALVIILAIAVPALNYYLNYVELQGLERERNMWEDRLAEIRPQEEVYFDLQEQIDNFRLPEEVEVERYAIAPAFQEFGVILPEGIGFEEIIYENGQLTIFGHAQNINEILNMVGNVFESDVFSLVSLERFQRDNIYQFNLTVNMHTRDVITGQDDADDEEESI
ncbi:PilN domain-containing protein [Halanaerobiaceae bacterium Z-7014]|uniref:PilN domain-containing protein n=1 Tax=Halonatronomonas betaini TaxID=2778430 RepID=A0A931AQM8_9FIRM|nr:PilN domain-containing protein [Halonatronomonas betaini]MBF8436712.1 PilN domain-containing protein [Halonatronomonas betaini]